MAKNTSKKIKELKGIKPEKIEEQELTDLQAVIRNIDRLTADIGRMETQKYSMLMAMQKVQGEIDVKRTEFLDKYGSDNINIQTGEIAYPEETSIKKENVEVNS
tara:strand:+ start:1414 stop:1725 length:312 start_codon:yes stop_codon:yes gene_type:complete